MNPAVKNIVWFQNQQHDHAQQDSDVTSLNRCARNIGLHTCTALRDYIITIMCSNLLRVYENRSCDYCRTCHVIRSGAWRCRRASTIMTTPGCTNPSVSRFFANMIRYDQRHTHTHTHMRQTKLTVYAHSIQSVCTNYFVKFWCTCIYNCSYFNASSINCMSSGIDK